ncbi:MAG: hypothetical protein QE274_15820 [Verrucomicrobiaceae bacterium]|nr:hypothetical protein [Verrucomicrobiaceae bacterium]
MKSTFVLFSLFCGLAIILGTPSHSFARGVGGGGASRPAPSRSPSKAPSKPASRPAPKPSASKPSHSKPAPSYRPTTKPAPSRPAPSKPSYSKPSKPPTASKPAPSRPDMGYRPQTRPSIPEAKPSRPSIPQTKPALPTTRPSFPDKRPGGDNDLVFKPSNRPTTLPGKLPPITNRPTTLPGKLPPITDRPTTLPGRLPSITDRPTTLPGKLPPITDRPTTLPGNRFPGISNRPTIPDPPGRPARPQRPDWPDSWQNNDNNFTNNSNQWNSNNQTVVNNFQINRNQQWNSVNSHWNQPGWHNSWGTPAYRTWHRDVWGYRGHRCNEIWYRTAPFHYHNSFFNVHWWGSCWWHPRPIVYAHSPWWWWRPVLWSSVGYFFGQAIAPQPIVYDPGTTVIYEGDTIYINGQSAGNATTYREQTIALANPVLEDIPVPTPPPDTAEPISETTETALAQPQGDWLPVGVWALTQQEQGDATMFFQLSIDKAGIVAGAYKNVMTGDEQPITGQLDFKSQRVAWHIGQVDNTVYETGLSNFENDVASLFVHFGTQQTQTWLLVRMPSPEMPPGTVKLPEIKDN